MTAPSFIDSQLGTDSSGSAGDSISITFAIAPVAGNLIQLAVFSGFQDGSNSIATPAGFSLFAGDSSKWAIFKKIATGSEGKTFTVGSVDQAGFVSGVLIAGNNTTTPIDNSTSTASSDSNSSFSTTSNNDLLISYLLQNSNIAGTQPSGYTMLHHNSVSSAHGGPISLCVAWTTQATAGATGTITWTGGNPFELVTIAIQPAGAAPTATVDELALGSEF